MTLLHQAAQKAVEALTELLNLWYAFGHINAAAEQRSRAAITALESALQQQPEPVALYVECRECGECGHAGINDAHPTDAACNSCDWRGPSPKEDHCPGCGKDGTMTDACPKCGCGRYTLVAGADVPALQHQEVPREPVALNDGVPDAEAAMAYALKRWGYKQGTGACIAFYRGACWLQLAASPSTPEKAGGAHGTPAPLPDEAFVGWKLVPIMPTKAMLDAADHKFQAARYSLAGFNARELAYKALLDAAPPFGVPSPIPHPLPAQANDGGEQ